MKSILAIILLQFLFPTDQDKDITSIKLTLQTRGNQKIIAVNPKSTEIEINGSITNTSTKPQEWKQLLEYLSKINLSKLSDYKSSGTQSHVDAAYITQLQVTKGAEVFQSESFDHSNPPKELSKLVKLMISKIPKDLQP